MKPDARRVPVVDDGSHGHAQRLRCFLDGEPAEESQLDDLARSRVERRQFGQRIVQCDDIHAGCRRRNLVGLRRQSLHALTALRRLTCARGVHQHATHHPGGGRVEVRPVLPMHGVPVEQANVRLLHEIGRLPSNGQPLAREHPASHLSQFALDERNELFKGLRVAAAPRLQQPGHIGGQRPRFYPCRGQLARSPVALQAAEFRL